MKHLKILVVDDRVAVCDIVSRVLSGLGVAWVESAYSGAGALRLIEETTEPFDVAIFDIDMPQQDGLVCIRRLASLARRPAVILMSGKDPMVLEAAGRVGEGLGITILGHLPKPVRTDDLAAMLESATARVARAPVAPAPLVKPEEISAAMAEERFEIWFQPQVDIASGKAVGAEALLRLRDPQRGLLHPDSFVGVAEASGVIAPLTDWVLERAARWSSLWHQAGLALNVSVNLSKAGLDDLLLPDRAAAICRRHSVPPGRLVLELTESSLALDPATLLDVMTRLRLKGFHLSLDDFGTGYASLDELRSLPFHELKLDQRFVQTATASARSRAILESSVRLADELRMSTVAEGIDTEETMALVASLGCRVAQGFLIARPMPAAAIADWLESHRPVPRPINGHRVQREATGDAPVDGGTDLAQAVSRFAHDAASPLMMVLSLSEMLLQTAASAQQPDLRQIRESGEEIARLVKSLRQQAGGPGVR